MIQFKKAVKFDSKGRFALIGPAGSGKSLTMLKMLRSLVGPSGKIACVDTEHGSLSKYADMYDFDVIELDTFSPDNFMGALKAAQDAGYDGFGCDSLSHFWMGQGGALEWVDNAKRRSSSRDDMSGWKEFSPVERRMVDGMIASSMHVGVTMRTKTEYQEEEYTDRNGQRRKKRVKIGLAPVQRQGLEYEFDFIGYMDEENNMLVDKTRCPEYAQAAIKKPSEKDFEKFAIWLSGAKREQIPTAPPNGTAYAAHVVATEKIDAMEQAKAEGRSVIAPADGLTDPEEILHAEILHAFSTSTKKDKGAGKFDILKEFKAVKDRFLALGEEATYRRVLKRCGVEKSNQFSNDAEGMLMARVAFKEMRMLLTEMEHAAQTAGAEAQ